MHIKIFTRFFSSFIPRLTKTIHAFLPKFAINFLFGSTHSIINHNLLNLIIITSATFKYDTFFNLHLTNLICIIILCIDKFFSFHFLFLLLRLNTWKWRWNRIRIAFHLWNLVGQYSLIYRWPLRRYKCDFLILHKFIIFCI